MTLLDVCLRERRRGRLLIQGLVVGVAAGGLSLLAPVPAFAQPCQEDLSANNSSRITVNVNGVPYLLCTIKANGYFDFSSNPWNGNNKLARDFAQAVLDKGYQNSNPYWSATINSLDKGNGKLDGPYFFYKLVGNDSIEKQQAKNVSYNSKGKINDGPDPLAADDYIYAAFDPIAAPAPLPLLGAGAAFGWSRRLRRRLNRANAGPQAWQGR